MCIVLVKYSALAPDSAYIYFRDQCLYQEPRASGQPLLNPMILKRCGQLFNRINIIGILIIHVGQ